MGLALAVPLPGWNVRGYSFMERTEDGRLHPGLDLNIGAGDEDLGRDVVAFSSGVVVARLPWDGRTYGYGNRLLVQHDWPDFHCGTLYAHLSEFDGSIAEGAAVAAGQRLAACGKSGLQTWAHLHFELRYVGPPAMGLDYWGGRLSVGEIVSRYADPGTALRWAALLGAMEPALPADCSEIRADRDYNYALKMAMEGQVRGMERAGRRSGWRPGATDALIAGVSR